MELSISYRGNDSPYLLLATFVDYPKLFFKIDSHHIHLFLM